MQKGKYRVNLMDRVKAFLMLHLSPPCIGFISIYNSYNLKLCYLYSYNPLLISLN